MNTDPSKIRTSPYSSFYTDKHSYTANIEIPQSNANTSYTDFSNSSVPSTAHTHSNITNISNEATSKTYDPYVDAKSSHRVVDKSNWTTTPGNEKHGYGQGGYGQLIDTNKLGGNISNQPNVVNDIQEIYEKTIRELIAVASVAYPKSSNQKSKNLSSDDPYVNNSSGIHTADDPNNDMKKYRLHLNVLLQLRVRYKNLSKTHGELLPASHDKPIKSINFLRAMAISGYIIFGILKLRKVRGNPAQPLDFYQIYKRSFFHTLGLFLIYGIFTTYCEVLYSDAFDKTFNDMKVRDVENTLNEYLKNTVKVKY